jgi:guanylate kinase
MSKLEQEEFLDLVRPIYENGYEPNQKVKDGLGSVSVVVLMGPSGAGKDTLRRKITVPPDSRVVGDTIREPRINNGVPEVSGLDYHFRGEKLAKVWKDVKQGRYVQMGMGPGKNSFYGSRPKQYPREGTAIIDLTAEQLAGMRELPFKSVQGLYVVPPSYDKWQDRLASRGELSNEELQHRYDEAKESLAISLADPLVNFVINDDLRRATLETRALINLDHRDQARLDEGRAIAAEMLGQLAA